MAADQQQLQLTQDVNNTPSQSNNTKYNPGQHIVNVGNESYHQLYASSMQHMQAPMQPQIHPTLHKFCSSDFKI